MSSGALVSLFEEGVRAKHPSCAASSFLLHPREFSGSARPQDSWPRGRNWNCRDEAGQMLGRQTKLLWLMGRRDRRGGAGVVGEPEGDVKRGDGPDG